MKDILFFDSTKLFTLDHPQLRGQADGLEIVSFDDGFSRGVAQVLQPILACADGGNGGDDLLGLEEIHEQAVFLVPQHFLDWFRT